MDRIVVTAAADGAELKLSWYRNSTAEPPGSAVLYLYGGSFVVPLLSNYDRLMRAYTKITGVPFLGCGSDTASDGAQAASADGPLRRKAE
ncbi:acetyl esterase/lipase [Mycobacterium sp. AZCC_0083]|nr:acetyl esterase/lipase [Mycobacterium sp. AZCC_0083]